MDRGSQDDTMMRQDQEQDYPRYLQLAPRSYTDKEVNKIQKVFNDNKTNL